MDKVTCFVGLDYHQHSVQVCVLDESGRQLLNRSVANDWRQIRDAVEPVGMVRRAALEACCGAADLGQELIERAGWAVDLAHSGYVARLKQSPDKSDYSDGRLLADLTRVGYLPRVFLPSAYERDLRQLVNHRQDLVDRRRAVKLRVGAVLREHRAKPPKELSRWSKAWRLWARSTEGLSDHARWIVCELLEEEAELDKKVIKAEGRLRQASDGDGLFKKLMKEEGIGEVTAWVLRAYVGDFSRFNNGKQLSRYCGLSPCNASSGQRQSDAGLINGCNKLLRATLIQAAHRLGRTSDRWAGLKRSLVGRGKAKCVATAAVANRWVRGLWHRLKADPQPPQQPRTAE